VLNSNSNLSKINEPVTIPDPDVPILRRLPKLLDINILFDIYFAVELTIIFALGWACAELYVVGHLGTPVILQTYVAYLLIAPIFIGLALSGTGCYRLENIAQFADYSGKYALSVLGGFVGLIAIGFIFGIDDEISRIWIAIWSASTLIFVLVSRAVAARILSDVSNSRVALSTIAVYGDRRPTQNLISEISRVRPNAQIVGVYGPSDASLASGNANWDGDIDDLLAYGRENQLDTIIIANSTLNPSILRGLLLKFSVLPSEVMISFGFDRSHIPIRKVHSLEDSQLLEVQRKPISGWGRLLKLIQDYVVAGISLALLSPLFLAIAVAIKLDSKGPVFFRQRRHGFNHKIFSIWKFRTMTVMEDGDKAVQATRNDARVTRVGRFLRRTSLDELPQLFNVLKGEMSIVGPRPHPLSLNSEFEHHLTKYDNRHVVKPGMTGWAQINGFRGPTEDPELMRRRVEFDLDYIENWSIWMDIQIIAATPFTLIFSKNSV